MEIASTDDMFESSNSVQMQPKCHEIIGNIHEKNRLASRFIFCEGSKLRHEREF